MDTLQAHGYAFARTSASGQRKGKRKEQRMIPGDLLAVALEPGRPHLQFEIGGIGKRLGAAFAELRSLPLPGFLPVVVRFVARKRRWYLSPDDCFRSFGELLAAAKGSTA
jgi:hypothetical protein